jgi:Concanavalin A-like lectin/glucanases superfamily
MRYLLCVIPLLMGACPGDKPEWPPTDGRAEGGAPSDGAVKEASGGDTGPGCGPSSCSGCCIAGQICATGASHTQCGSGGALCVDCTKSDPSSTCASGSCSSCTPDCTNKTCGASDGCGGSCKAGSGCCSPTCSGKLCGAADGCGGSCAAGSGCCTPSCSSKACGASDGCGGTCAAGSGCKPPCVDKGDADTVALYTFEGSGTTVTDSTGKHHGKLVGSGAARVSGKSYCGDAMGFPGSTPEAYVEIPDSTDFDLSKGAVDFWVRFDATASGSEGVFSRDASGTTNAGHITMFRLCNGSLLLRLQSTTNSYHQCSDPITAKSWHHVGVNFGGTGGLTFYVDGTLAGRTASITCGTTVNTCGAAATVGINGNDNPWVLGAAAWNSTEGAATPVNTPLKGQIDSFRLSKANRSF